MSIEEPPIQQEYTAKAIQQVLNIVQQYMVPGEVAKILQAFELVQEYCGRGARDIDLIQRTLDLATILAQMQIDATGVAAGLIFEVVDADRLPLERVENALGPSVAHIADIVRQINALEHKKHIRAALKAAQPKGEVDNNPVRKKQRARTHLQQAEKARIMFFTLARDPHAIILKLAHQLHILRAARNASHHFEGREILRLAQETREIYAPLAGRLGIFSIESQLEDLAFEILEPEAYAWIRTHVEMESKQWDSYVDRVCSALREELAQLDLKAEVSGRVKHLYSIYKKLRRNYFGEAGLYKSSSQGLEELKAADLSQIHDLIAFRILVESSEDCYAALKHIHTLWKPKESKDYIMSPKPNGYRALHTTVSCLDEQLVEIQIRTFEMHEVAEYGMAMYWYRKEATNATSLLSRRERLAWMRELEDWLRNLHSSASGSNEFVGALNDSIHQELIFVFTPKGDIIDLPPGSTPLDFAYRIHSEVGHRYSGARIITENDNGNRLTTRMVSLDYELKNGDVVEIITRRTAGPRPDWLRYARTAAARSKIRSHLRKMGEAPNH